MSDSDAPRMSDQEWLAAFAERVGTEPPTNIEIERLLHLAGIAAHASQRTAAPVACWLAGRLGLPLDAAIREAEAIRPLR